MSGLPTRPMRMTVPLACLALLATGCGQPSGRPRTEPGRPEAPRAAAHSCPSSGPAREGASAVIVEWVDFIQLDGRQYVAAVGGRSHPPVPAAQLGPAVGVTACKIAGSSAGPDYQLRDGDAAFLPPGTVVRTIRGVPTTRAVTASRDGRYLYYAAQPAP